MLIAEKNMLANMADKKIVGDYVVALLTIGLSRNFSIFYKIEGL